MMRFYRKTACPPGGKEKYSQRKKSAGRLRFLNRLPPYASIAQHFSALPLRQFLVTIPKVDGLLSLK